MGNSGSRYLAPTPYGIIQKLPHALEIKLVISTPYHFNLKAPISLRQQKENHWVDVPMSKMSLAEQEIRFAFPFLSPALSQLVHWILSIYLCDTGSTFCEKHVLGIDWDGSRLQIGENDS